MKITPVTPLDNYDHPLHELLRVLMEAEPGMAFDVSDLPAEYRWEERYFEEQLFELGIRVRVARLDSARTPQSYRITVLQSARDLQRGREKAARRDLRKGGAK